MSRFIIASRSALHSASQSSTTVFELCPFVLSGADGEAGAAAVEFGVPVSASGLLCRIVIPVSAPQTKQRCFFTFRLLLAFLSIAKSFSKTRRGTCNHSSTDQFELFAPV